MDKFSAKYAGMSTFQYGALNPIVNIDVNGDSIKIAHNGNNFLYKGGKLFLNGEEYTGKVKGFLKRTVKGLNEIASTSTGGEMLDELSKSEHNIVIKYKSNGAFFVTGFESFGKPDLRNNAEGLRVQETGKKVLDFFDFTGVGSGGTVYWDSYARPNGAKPNMVLAHELFHGFDAIRGMLDSRSVEVNGGREQIQEIRAVYNTNLIRSQLGRAYREKYSNGPRLLDSNGKPINVSPPYKF